MRKASHEKNASKTGCPRIKSKHTWPVKTFAGGGLGGRKGQRKRNKKIKATTAIPVPSVTTAVVKQKKGFNFLKKVFKGIK
jgi:hypothetical protein